MANSDSTAGQVYLIERLTVDFMENNYNDAMIWTDVGYTLSLEAAERIVASEQVHGVPSEAGKDLEKDPTMPRYRFKVIDEIVGGPDEAIVSVDLKVQEKARKLWEAANG